MERMDEARRVRAMKSRRAFFGRIIWPLAIVIIFVVAIFFAKGCGGGGGGSDTPKAENLDSNTDTNKNAENSPPDNSADPPLPNSDNTTPPPDNADTTTPPDVKTAGLIQLPKTGQTISYVKGDDGEIQAGVAWPNPRFIDNGNGTVTDDLTGLMWSKNADLAKGAVSYSQSDYHFQSLPGGYSNWRLPSIYELESLVDISQADPALPPNHPFINVSPGLYWTSTDIASSQYEGAVAVIDFSNGAVYLTGQNSHYAFILGVRASGKKGVVQIPQIRSGICYNYLGNPYACSSGVGVPQPSPRFVDNKDGTVTDKLIGLMWSKDMSISSLYWKDALEYVAAMNRGEKPNFGYTDWRVPNRKELFYMLDWTNDPYSKFAGSSIFTDETGAIWSSTAAVNNSNKAWMYFFFGHSIQTGEENSSFALWPVRTVPAK